MDYIRWFETITLDDIARVGGKNASLGEMTQFLLVDGILVPPGFAITVDGYKAYCAYNNLNGAIDALYNRIHDTSFLQDLPACAASLRAQFCAGSIPADLAHDICSAYKKLSLRFDTDSCDVAVRSSATAEDLPTASFAGQQETYLNIVGCSALLDACKKAWASLFTDRSFVYRLNQGISASAALSIGVQKMVRPDLSGGSAGVAFSLDTESGARSVIMINGSYGLGEALVQGLVTPDEFIVHKEMMRAGKDALLQRKKGDKKIKIVYTQCTDLSDTDKSVPDKSVCEIDCTQQEQDSFCMTDKYVIEIARSVLMIEEYYSKRKGAYQAMDVEWAIDGANSTVYITQARPETVYSQQKNIILGMYRLEKNSAQKIIATGQSIGQKIVVGPVRCITNLADIGQLEKGDILVTPMTDPDWMPALKKVAGIITEHGGRTCHAAIVSRELGIPAVVGVQNACSILSNGQVITLDCSQGSRGFVYDGSCSYTIDEIATDTVGECPVPVFVNCAIPDSALRYAQLPVAGVGLARIEFIISTLIQVHPLLLAFPDKIQDQKTQDIVLRLIQGYSTTKDFFVDQLARAVSLIAGAFYPRPVIVRFSDFKTNEYRQLVGGERCEPHEENPMIGFRGAARYYNQVYGSIFALECAAMAYVRDMMGLTNLKLMVPFVRTLEEGKKVISLMKEYGLVSGVNGLEIIMMCEVPSNIFLIDEFAVLFDGFSIGSNDLTQLILGVDRDSAYCAHLFDEEDAAVKKAIIRAIEGAHNVGKKIGICGQGPSDYPYFAQFLIDQGIDSLSLSADSIASFLKRFCSQGVS